MTRLSELPQGGRAFLDVPVVGHDLLFGDPMLAPGDALSVEIEQDRVQPVQSRREAGIGRGSLLKLLPQRLELLCLIFRKQPKNPLGCSLFSLLLSRRPASS